MQLKHSKHKDVVSQNMRKGKADARQKRFSGRHRSLRFSAYALSICSGFDVRLSGGAQRRHLYQDKRTSNRQIVFWSSNNHHTCINPYNDFEVTKTYSRDKHQNGERPLTLLAIRGVTIKQI